MIIYLQYSKVKHVYIFIKVDLFVNDMYGINDNCNCNNIDKVNSTPAQGGFYKEAENNLNAYYNAKATVISNQASLRSIFSNQNMFESNPDFDKINSLALSIVSAVETMSKSSFNYAEAVKKMHKAINPDRGCLITETIDSKTKLSNIEKARTFILSKYKNEVEMSDIMDALLIYNTSPIVNIKVDKTKIEEHDIAQVGDMVYNAIYKKEQFKEGQKVVGKEDKYIFTFPKKANVSEIEISKNVIDLVIDAFKVMESKDSIFTKPTFELNKSSNKNQIEFVLSSKLASINPKSDIRNLKVKINGEPNDVVKDYNHADGLLLIPALLDKEQKSAECREMTVELELGYVDFTDPFKVSYIDTSGHRLYADFKSLSNPAKSEINKQVFKVKVGKSCK